MGTIYAVASQKGGVGKTTTVLNLGFSLARLGGRALLIDGDPQGGLALATNVKKRARGGLVDVLTGRIGAQDALTLTRDGSMGVVGVGLREPGDLELFEREAAGGGLSRVIRELAPGFETVLLDCPGGIGGLTRTLMTTADAVLGVVTCRALAVRSLPELLRVFHGLAAATGRPRFAGLVRTMLDPNSASEADLSAKLEATLPAGTLLRTAIPLDPHFEQASLRSLPVAMLTGAEDAARRYLDLAFELRARNARFLEGGADDDRAEGLF